MEEISPPVIILVTDPAVLSFRDRLRLHIALDDFVSADLRRQGMDGGLELLSSTQYNVQKPAFDTSGSEYDLFQQPVPEESLTTAHFSRAEVYKTVRELARPGKADILIASLEKKYPLNIWAEHLPDSHTIAYLVKECRDCF